MNPSIFDWRAVSWASSYPNLDPQKIVIGTSNRCMSCTIINAAFQSVGLDLQTLQDTEYIGLYNKEEKGSLLLLAVLIERSTVVVELYTVPGEFLSSYLDIVLVHVSDTTLSQCVAV
jgi:hypothetical protein